MSRINNFFKWLAILAILLMMVLSTIDVILRFVFEVALFPSMSICECMMVVMTFAGLAATEEAGAHINVTILTMRLSQNRQAILKVIASFLCLCFFILMFYSTLLDGLWAYSVKTYRTGDLWRFPTWWCRLFIPLGILVMLGQLIINMKKNINIYLTAMRGEAKQTGMEGGC